MKVRNGFVSNSSSSSFVVTKDMTTGQVFRDFVWAKMKYNAEMGNYIDENEGEVKHRQSLQYCLEWSKQNLDYDKPLIFPYSCNYDTKIWRSKDNTIHVATCNNDCYTNYIDYLYPIYDLNEIDNIFHDEKVKLEENNGFKIMTLPKEQIVCVSGFFNPLHVGHVRLFQAAKALGTKLVVVLNNDVQAIKKKGGIIINQDDRKELIEALWCVDECVIAVDKDETVCETLRLVKPNIFANGGDRVSENVPEVDVCKELGIKMVWNVGGGKHDSSTDIIKRAKEFVE